MMMRQESGSIINTTSVNGSRAGYIALTYATAKAAVIHLAKCVAVELGPNGVNCLIRRIAPHHRRRIPKYTLRDLSAAGESTLDYKKNRLAAGRGSPGGQQVSAFCSCPVLERDVLQSFARRRGSSNSERAAIAGTQNGICPPRHRAPNLGPRTDSNARKPLECSIS